MVSVVLFFEFCSDDFFKSVAEFVFVVEFAFVGFDDSSFQSSQEFEITCFVGVCSSASFLILFFF